MRGLIAICFAAAVMLFTAVFADTAAAQQTDAERMAAEAERMIARGDTSGALGLLREAVKHGRGLASAHHRGG